MFKQVLKIGLGLSLVASSLLAAPEKTKLKIGFIALTDCAPLVIAKEKGFFAAEGLDVDIRELFIPTKPIVIGQTELTEARELIEKGLKILKAKK